VRVIIIPSQNFISVDGKSYGDIDLSFLDPSIHAVQWYSDIGEVEIKNTSTGKMIENREIFSLDEFQPAINLWNEKHTAAQLASGGVVGDMSIVEEFY